MLVMCGPTGMDMMGDAMVDAGNLLRDGASDTGSDAQAQACATNCSASGVMRVMTADTDPAQLVTAVVNYRGSGASEAFEVVAGPLVLTDLEFAQEGYPHLLFSITTQATCPPAWYPPETDPLTTIGLDGQDSLTSVNTRYVHELHGSRFYIPVGSRLCAHPHQNATWFVRYAGFRPYD